MRASVSAAELAAIVARASTYVRRLHIYPLSEAELTGLLVDAGLKVVMASTIATGPGDGRNVGGIGVPSNARHACMVARRQPGSLAVLGERALMSSDRC